MPKASRLFRTLAISVVLAVSAAGCNLDENRTGLRWFGAGPASPASGSTIDLGGGAGTVGSGGDGDQEYGIWLDNHGPLGVKVYRTGSADASFTLDVPAPTPGFGSEPLTVTADMEIPVYDADPPDNDVYYFLRDDFTLYHKIDDSTINAVTGIRVGAGATLTLPIMTDRDWNGWYDSAGLDLENDLEVLGTLRTAAFEDGSWQESGEAIDRAGLVLNTSGGVFIRSSGVVSTAGDNVATGPGGNAGAIELVGYFAEGIANNGILVNEGLIDASGGSTDDPAAYGGTAAAYGAYDYCVNLYADAQFVNTGSIRADGGSGGYGGRTGGWYGSPVYVGGSGTVQNAGPISLRGGTGTNGDGANGGSLDVQAGGAFLHNSGAISNRGGNGSANGGYAGDLSLYVSGSGDLLNSGTIDAGGGDSTGTDDSIPTGGGRGGQVFLWTYAGALLSSGSIEAGGGDVANLNPASGGGSGGYIDIESYSGGSGPSGAMEISGDILARGGTGPYGGYGGALYMYYGDSSGTGGIVLRGYSSLANDGGDGIAYGGGGGGIYLEDWYAGGLEGAGGVLADADLSANGGAADPASGYGGSGGYLELRTNVPPSRYGGVTADGGAAAHPGGTGTIDIDGGAVM